MSEIGGIKSIVQLPFASYFCKFLVHPQAGYYHQGASITPELSVPESFPWYFEHNFVHTQMKMLKQSGESLHYCTLLSPVNR